MAYVAATATHLSVMPAHIWQSHPRPPSSPNSSADAAQDLASTGPILASSAASLSLPPPLPLPPASTQAVWSARPAPPHAGPVDLTAAPLPPLRARPQQSSALDPDAQGDANSLLFDILKLRIDEQSAMSHTAVASGTPFHSAATSHPLQPASRLAVSPMHDLHMDHHGTHRPLFMQSPASDLVPLHDPVGAMPMGASFATPLRVDNGNIPALRTSSVLRQPGGPPSAPSMIHASASSAAQSTQATPRIKNELYKTEICRSFSETGGFCKYGSKCQFAHGDAELRPVRRHPRYKTKQCRNYITTGSCPYGARCRFIHATDPPYNQPSGHATAASGASISPSPASVMGHQALPHLQHSQRADPVQNMGSSEKYADGLQSFMNTNSSSATSAHHVEDLIEAMNMESGVAGTLLSGGHVEKVVASSMPANRVYRANAHAFQSYGVGNVFYNHYMHPGGGENDLLYPTAEFAENPHVQADRNPVKPGGSYGAAGSGAEISRRFEAPGPERDRSDVYTHPDSGHSSTSPPTQVLSTAAGPAESSSCASVNGESSRLPSSSPQVSRSRLPVFRNMAFGSDDQH